MLAYTNYITFTQVIGAVLMFFGFMLATSKDIHTRISKTIFWFMFFIGILLLVMELSKCGHCIW
ncbi:hypothetical protein D3C87_1371460 [compost metagenome]